MKESYKTKPVIEAKTGTNLILNQIFKTITKKITIMKAIKSNLTNGFFGKKQNDNQEFITIEDWGMDAEAFNSAIITFDTEIKAQEFINENNMSVCFVSEFTPEKDEDYYNEDGTTKF